MIKLRPRITFSSHDFVHRCIKRIKEAEKTYPFFLQQRESGLIRNMNNYKSLRPDTYFGSIVLEDTMKYIEMLNYLDRKNLRK